MKATSLRELLPVFVVVGLTVYLLIRLAYASLPPLPTLAGVTLLVLAVAEAILGYYLKARIERKSGTEPVQPLQAARAVALAKASAVAGTVMAGTWAGVLGYLLPRLSDLVAAAEDAPGALVGLISAVALVAAALYLQHCCRTPLDSDDENAPRR